MPNRWDVLAQGAQSRVDNVNPLLREQGLAGMLAQNLERQGGEANMMAAQQMQQNPGAGLGAWSALGNRAQQDAQNAQYQGTGALRGSQARQTDVLTGLMQNGYNGQGSSGLGGVADAFALASGDSDKVQGRIDRNRYTSGWEAKELDTYRGRDAKDMQRFGGIVELHSALPNFDSSDPLSVYKMLTLFQKGIDEGVVRQDDVANIQAATGTGIQELKAMALRFVQAGTSFPEVMGDALKKQLNTSSREKMGTLAQLGKAHEAFGDQAGWSENGRNRAIPYRKETAAFEAGLNNLAQGFMHTTPEGEQVMVAPSGDGYQTINPVTGEFTD